MRPVPSSPRPARLAAIAATFAVLGIVLGAATASAAGPGADNGRHLGRGSAKGGSVNLIDHGGPVLVHSDTYLVFWGTFPATASDEVAAMDKLFAGFGGSNYLAIANEYLRGGTASSTYHGYQTDTSAPSSHAPKASDLGAEAAKAWGSVQANALYVVFTSNFPHVNYCAWHDHTTVNGTPIEVAYVPLQPHGCSPYTVINLGANAYSDTAVAAADSAAHEFMETVTDPDLNAWYDGSGGEIADKCNYNYISVVTLANRSRWQIQSEWSNAAGGCVQGS
jgi:hypothetical protein